MQRKLEEETFESREIFSKAEMFIKKGDYAKATILLNEALKISPTNSLYISHLGLCIGMQGNMIAGEHMCRKAISLSPFVPIHFVNLGRVLLKENRRQEAREAFVRAYELDNTNAPAALELSRMGIRKRPVLPFLSRNHPLNVFLGKVRHNVTRVLSERRVKTVQ